MSDTSTTTTTQETTGTATNGTAGDGTSAGGNGSSGTGAGAGNASTNAAGDWISALPEEMRGFVQTKAFGTPADAILSYQNLEKLMGGSPDKLIKLADNWDKDPAIQGEIFSKLGKPLKADDYQVEIPTENGSKEMADWAKGVFHEANLTKAQAQVVSAKWNDYMKNQSATVAASSEKAVEAEMGALKKEWGAAYDQSVKQAQAAYREFGLTQEAVSKMQGALGFSETMKFLQRVGSKVGEDGFTTGNSGNSGAMTPESASHQIKSYMADKNFANKYLSGDMEARKIMDRLHEFAVAGKTVDL